MVASAPVESVGLALAAVAATGAAAGLVFKGGLDICTQIAPVEDRGKLISSYYVACYLGGFSVPLLVIGALSDLMGLTAALAILSGAAALGRGLDLGGRAALAVGPAGARPAPPAVARPSAE